MVCENEHAMLASMNKHTSQASRATLSQSTLTANQLRAGRAIAQLRIRELAEASGVSATAISHLETGYTQTPHRATVVALRAALTAHGVAFALGGWTRHIADAQHAAQFSPPSSTHGTQVDDTDDDRPDADDDCDTDGEPEGPDWQEVKQWLRTAFDKE